MFGSSAINKSSKKVAPKAPIRRRAGAASSTPQPSTKEATPTAAGNRTSTDVEEGQKSTPTPTLGNAVQDASNAQRPTTEHRAGNNGAAQPRLAVRRHGRVSSEEPTIGRAASQPQTSSASAPTTRAAPTNQPRRATPSTTNERDSVSATATPTVERASAQSEDSQASASTSAEATLTTTSQIQSQDTSATVDAGAATLNSQTSLTREAHPTTGKEPPKTRTRSQVETSAADNARSAPTPVRKEKQTTKGATQKRKSTAEVTEEATPGVDAEPATKKARKVRKDKGTSRKPKSPAVVPAGGEQNVGEKAQASEAGLIATGTKASKRKRSTPRTQSNTPAADPPDDAQALSIEPGDEDAIDPEEHPRRRGRRKKVERSPTPDDAEILTITEAEVIMGDLTMDQRIGRLSALEKRMRNINWAEVTERNRLAKHTPGEPRTRTREPSQARESEERAEGEENGGPRIIDYDDLATNYQGPRMKMVNGQMIIDESTLTVSNNAHANFNLADINIVEEDELTAQLNSHSFVTQNRRDPADRRLTPNTRWRSEDDTKFYLALGMFGTDFTMIASMFPDRTRKNIKHKFTREERQNPALIKAALVGQVKTPMDIAQFVSASNITEDDLVDPTKLAEELAAITRQKQPEIDAAKKEYAEIERQRRLAEGGESSKENDGAKKKKRKKKNQMSVGEHEEVIDSIEDGFDIAFG